MAMPSTCKHAKLFSEMVIPASYIAKMDAWDSTPPNVSLSTHRPFVAIISLRQAKCAMAQI